VKAVGHRTIVPCGCLLADARRGRTDPRLSSCRGGTVRA
jgi:hypothetical protein